MNGRLAGALLIAGFVAATSPVWAFAAANPTFSSDSASPGQLVSFSGSLSGAKTSGACDVVDPQADETLSASCSYDPATGFSGWFRVPATATPGTSYLLVFCGPSGCATDRAAREWSFRDAISITAPPVVVPAVSCLSYGDAMSALSSRGLHLLKTPFPWPIGRVDPPENSVSAFAPDDWRLYFLMRELPVADRIQVLRFAEMLYNLRHAMDWADDTPDEAPAHLT